MRKETRVLFDCVVLLAVFAICSSGGQSYIKPLEAVADATTAAMQLTGFGSLPGIDITEQKLTVPEDNTPFLAHDIVGRPAWDVQINNVTLKLSSCRSTPDSYVRTFDVLVDQTTGQLLRIRSRSNAPTPVLRPAPSAESAADQLTSTQEKYHDLPIEPPRVSLLTALDRICAGGIGNPLLARKISAVYVIESKGNSAGRPVWAITLRGIPPRKAHGFNADSVPEWQRDHIRNVVNAVSGQVLFATTVPQPI